jgi:hypothetical protein
MVVPDSTSATITGIVDAFTPKGDVEDQMNAAMRKQVITGSESIFTMLMMHGVDCDLQKIMTMYQKCNDGCHMSLRDFIEDAQKLANQLALFLAERNVKKRAAHEAKQTGRGPPSSKATSIIS